MTKKINIIFLVPLFLYSFYCLTQLGEIWDTWFQYELGKDRLKYLFSFGSNEVDMSMSVRKFYPGAYSTISAFLLNFFPKSFLRESINLINLIFSTLAIFGIYRITRELFNKHIGKVAFLLCFFNPIFFGHMSINGSDTIVVFANVWFFYLCIQYLKCQQQNKKRLNYTIYLGFLLGLGLGVRYTFLITLIPIFIFLFCEIFYLKIYVKKNFSKKIFYIDGLKIIIIAYLFMVFFWPETHQNIFLQPIKLIIQGFSFGFGVPFTLFNGEILLTNQLPKSYLLVNLFYKMPEFIILSFVIFGILFYKISFYFREKIKSFRFKIFLILLIIVFPNLLLFLNPYGIYDGIRLFLYLIPFICVIPAVTIYYVYKMLKSKFYKFIFIFLIIFKLFFLFNFFSLTPYHYVYLNIFAGKYSENLNKFENDYWGASTKNLISKISKHSEILKKDKVKIALCGVVENAQDFYLRKIENLKYEIVDYNENFDFIIMNNRVFWDLRKNDYNPKNAQTCFDKFTGEDIIKIERRNLVISKITKI